MVFIKKKERVDSNFVNQDKYLHLKKHFTYFHHVENKGCLESVGALWLSS